MLSRAAIRFLFIGGLLLAAATPLGAQDTRGQVPTNATAKCKDGTYSAAKNERGACSRHGGIAQWYGASLPTAATQPTRSATDEQDVATPAGATARCGDGTYSTSNGRGACSNHGGVAERLPTATTQPPANEAQDSATVAGASARCKDGTYSHSVHRSGTCSRHGGVAEWLRRPGRD